MRVRRLGACLVAVIGSGFISGCRASSVPTNSTGAVPAGTSAQKNENPTGFGGPSNLVGNPSFEVSSIPWQGLDKYTVIRRERRPAQDGRFVLAVDPNGLFPFGAMLAPAIGYPSKDAILIGSVWIKALPSSRGKHITLDLGLMRTNGGTRVFAHTAIIATGRWQKLTVSGRVPTTGLGIAVFTTQPNTISLTDGFYLDGVLLRLAR